MTLFDGIGAMITVHGQVQRHIVTWRRWPDLSREGKPAIARRTQALDR